MANTIKLKKYSDVIEEYVAASALTPGHLIELTSAGTVQVHGVASGSAAPKMFALENELEGEGIDDAYAALDQVQCWIPYPGDQVNAILADDSSAVVIGDLLVSNGDGALKKLEADSDGADEWGYAIVAEALEAVDLTGSSGEESSGPLGYDKRIRVRIV